MVSSLKSIAFSDVKGGVVRCRKQGIWVSQTLKLRDQWQVPGSIFLNCEMERIVCPSRVCSVTVRRQARKPESLGFVWYVVGTQEQKPWLVFSHCDHDWFSPCHFNAHVMCPRENNAHVKHGKGESKAEKSELDEGFRKQFSWPGSVGVNFYDPKKLHLSFPSLSVMCKMRK